MRAGRRSEVLLNYKWCIRMMVIFSILAENVCHSFLISTKYYALCQCTFLVVHKSHAAEKPYHLHILTSTTALASLQVSSESPHHTIYPNKLNDNNAFNGEWVLLVADINVLKSILMFSNIYATPRSLLLLLPLLMVCCCRKCAKERIQLSE